ncbi:hypothetical protein G3I48_07345, partial [Streptomyces griseus]|uniref:hypothetical protein n=1 Tax=Streptomyces griseus TaxID=1911 RepID=UPI0013BCE004|nr:hypothetical protein [Streptomyces griseus]
DRLRSLDGLRGRLRLRLGGGLHRLLDRGGRKIRRGGHGHRLGRPGLLDRRSRLNLLRGLDLGLCVHRGLGRGFLGHRLRDRRGLGRDLLGHRLLGRDRRGQA